MGRTAYVSLPIALSRLDDVIERHGEKREPADYCWTNAKNISGVVLREAVEALWDLLQSEPNRLRLRPLNGQLESVLREWLNRSKDLNGDFPSRGEYVDLSVGILGSGSRGLGPTDPIGEIVLQELAIERLLFRLVAAEGSDLSESSVTKQILAGYRSGKFRIKADARDAFPAVGRRKFDRCIAAAAEAEPRISLAGRRKNLRT